MPFNLGTISIGILDPLLNIDALAIRGNLTSLLNTIDINISGCTRLYLIKTSRISSIVTNPVTNIVTNIVSNTAWSVLNNLKDLNFNTTVDSSRNGILYITDISFTIQKVSTIKNKVVLGLTSGEYTCIIQDNNETFWLIGADQSFKNNGIKLGSDIGGYSVKLNNKELQPLLEVAPTFIQGMQLAPFADSSQAVQAASLAYLSVPVAASAGTGGTKKICPVDAYTASNDVDYILATSGYTVNLAPNPVQGQLITIKDGGSGGTNPVIIKGNGHSIESYADAEVNTDGGAIQLIFINGGWLINNFWNI